MKTSKNVGLGGPWCSNEYNQPPLGGWETGNMALESLSFHRHHTVVGFDRIINKNIPKF